MEKRVDKSKLKALYKDIKCMACYRRDKILAVWPVGIIRKGPLRIVGSLLPAWNTVYPGPIFLEAYDECSKEKINALSAILKNNIFSIPALIATRCMNVEEDLASLG